jgi:hypothetical protein
MSTSGVCLGESTIVIVGLAMASAWNYYD